MAQDISDDLERKIRTIPGLERALISDWDESHSNYYEADVVQNGQTETFGLLHLTRENLDVVALNLMCIADSSYIIKVHQIYAFENEIIAIVDRLKYFFNPTNMGTTSERIECVFRVLRAVMYCQTNMIKVPTIGERQLYFSDPNDQKSIMLFPGWDSWITEVVSYPQPESFYGLCLSIFLAMYSEEVDLNNLDAVIFYSGLDDIETIRRFLSVVRRGTTVDVLLRDPIFNHLYAAPPIGFKSVSEPPPVSDVSGLIQLINMTRPYVSMKAFFTGIDLWYRTTALVMNGSEKNQAIFRLVLHLFRIESFITLKPNEFKIITHLGGAMFRYYLYDAANSLEQLISTYQNIIPFPDVYRQVDIVRWFQQIPQGSQNKNVMAESIF